MRELPRVVVVATQHHLSCVVWRVQRVHRVRRLCPLLNALTTREVIAATGLLRHVAVAHLLGLFVVLWIVVRALLVLVLVDHLVVDGDAFGTQVAFLWQVLEHVSNPANTAVHANARSHAKHWLVFCHVLLVHAIVLVLLHFLLILIILAAFIVIIVQIHFHIGAILGVNFFLQEVPHVHEGVYLILYVLVPNIIVFT